MSKLSKVFNPSTETLETVTGIAAFSVFLVPITGLALEVLREREKSEHSTQLSEVNKETFNKSAEDLTNQTVTVGTRTYHFTAPRYEGQQVCHKVIAEGGKPTFINPSARRELKVCQPACRM